MKTHVWVYDPQQEAHKKIRSRAFQFHWAESVDELMRKIKRSFIAPYIVLAKEEAQTGVEIKRTFPELPVFVLIDSEATVEEWRTYTGMGFEGVIRRPLTHEAMKQAVEESRSMWLHPVTRSVQEDAAAAPVLGKTVLMAARRGGVGVTTLTLALAQLLYEHRLKVLIWEISPNGNLSFLLQQSRPTDEPVPFAYGTWYHGPYQEKKREAFSKRYDFILIDAGPLPVDMLAKINVSTWCLLARLDPIEVEEWLEHIDAYQHSDRELMLIFNAVKKQTFSAKRLREAVGVPVFFLPFEARVPEQLEHEKRPLPPSRSALKKALEDWVTDWIPMHPYKERGRRWFGLR